MNHFINSNSKSRNDEHGNYEISETDFLKELKQSIESGLVVDSETGIFIRKGYGALVGVCPSNCNTIQELINYTYNDFHRKKVGKPTLMEKLHEIKNDSTIMTSPHFGYKEYMDEGYDLVIGPGCYVNGEKWEKAVYCKNYLEIMEREKQNNKTM